MRKLYYLMKLNKIAFSALSAFAFLSANAEQHTNAYNVDFLVNSSEISTSVSNNNAVLSNLNQFLRDAQQNDSLKVVEITYCGYASPEGPTDLNNRLSKERCRSLARYVEARSKFPDAKITEGADIDIWEEVIAQLGNSDYQYADEAIRILKDDTGESDYNNPYKERVARIKKLHKGKVWRHINENILSPMRNATVTFVTFETIPPQPVVIEEPNPVYVEESTLTVDEEIIEKEEWQPHIYLKSNAIGWAMLIANAAAEWEFHPHWSLTLPLYYSGVNYFTRTVKFRTLAFQPELRYWARNNNEDGFFAGIHFGVAKYNFAIGGTYRFQDWKAKRPALGGGISIGYRIPITKDRRWKMEFTAGAGVYSLKTDHFRNVYNGEKVYTNKKVWYGLDNVAVTFMYMFDLNRGGNK